VNNKRHRLAIELTRDGLVAAAGSEAALVSGGGKTMAARPLQLKFW
jgi:hypothetical protein